MISVRRPVDALSRCHFRLAPREIPGAHNRIITPRGSVALMARGFVPFSLETGRATRRSARRHARRDGNAARARAGSRAAAHMLVKGQDWPLPDKLAQRAKLLLPLAIQQAGGGRIRRAAPAATDARADSATERSTRPQCSIGSRPRRTRTKHDLHVQTIDLKQTELALKMRELERLATSVEQLAD